MVDDKLAEQTWPNEDAVGKGMQIVRFNVETFAMERESVQVVGVVRHVRSESLTVDGRGAVYYTYRFFPWWPMVLTVRGGDVLRSLSKKKMYGSPNSNPSPELGADKENHTSWERYYQVSDCSSSLRNDWYSGI